MDKEKQIEQLESELSEAKQEAQENLDGWKRAKADFINYKKRQEELMAEFRKFACENVVQDFLPVLDNMALSLEHIPEDQKDQEWAKGIMHIKRMLEDALKANGIEEIEIKEGDEFDPEICEAMQAESSKVEKLKVKEVLRKGYRLNGRVVRAAKVIVE